MYLKERDFDPQLEKSCNKVGLQVALLKSIIALTSEFEHRYADYSSKRYGLCGIRLDQAQSQDKRIYYSDLFDADKNIEVTCLYLRFLLNRAGLIDKSLDNPDYYDIVKFYLGSEAPAFEVWWSRYFYFSQRPGEPSSYYPHEAPGTSIDRSLLK